MPAASAPTADSDAQVAFLNTTQAEGANGTVGGTATVQTGVAIATQGAGYAVPRDAGEYYPDLQANTNAYVNYVNTQQGGNLPPVPSDYGALVDYNHALQNGLYPNAPVASDVQTGSDPWTLSSLNHAPGALKNYIEDGLASLGAEGLDLQSSSNPLTRAAGAGVFAAGYLGTLATELVVPDTVTQGLIGLAGGYTLGRIAKIPAVSEILNKEIMSFSMSRMQAPPSMLAQAGAIGDLTGLRVPSVAGDVATSSGGGIIPWSSRTVRDASQSLDWGGTEVTVSNRSEAEELFLGQYQGDGYTNTTGMSPTEAKDLFGSKAGTYHWDIGEDNFPHGMDHLQVHTHEGDVIRIYFPGN